LDLCKGKGELQLEEMSKLYVQELAIAGAAACGQYAWPKGDGDHVGAAVTNAKADEPAKSTNLFSFFRS
jgi:hypothetical protein